MLVLIAALWALVFGALAWVLARRYDRAASLWAVFGVLLGPLAIAILRVAPPGRCPECGARVHGWESICLVCDSPLAAGRRRSRRPEASLEEAMLASTEHQADDGRSGIPSPEAGTAEASKAEPGRRASRRRRKQTAPPTQAPEAEPRSDDRIPAPGATAEMGPSGITLLDGRSDQTDPELTNRDTNTAIDRARARSTAARLRERLADQPAGTFDTARGETSTGRPADEPRRADGETKTANAAEPAARLVVVFVVGSESLVIGARYMLAVEDAILTVAGPLDTSPGSVRLRRRIRRAGRQRDRRPGPRHLEGGSSPCACLQLDARPAP